MIDLGNGKNTTMLKELESERPTGDVDMRLVIQPGFEEKLAEMSTTNCCREINQFAKKVCSRSISS
jgi:hypothetical protein